MDIKNKLAFKSLLKVSRIPICFLLTTACNQLTRYGMNSSSSEEDSESDTEQIEMNFVPTAHFWDSLHIATEKGDIERVNQLCSDSGVDVNTKNDFDNTPLHLAANNGHISVVRKLLSVTNMVNEENVFGKTPLDLALQNGHEEVVALLRSAGAVSSQYKQ
ncbi:ankyrin repeat domain-containing protein [Candidatus Cardinium hertigii]|uniref:ankyrin repeat domain-containing protein n=1 Tax=Candidatus Cardinium hertigii TaxID=247481 RepID=UPI003D7C93A4